MRIWMSAFLGLSMCVSMFVGCGGGTEPVTSGPLTAEEEAAAEADLQQVEDAERAEGQRR